jgi:uncharacterized membrane protein
LLSFLSVAAIATAVAVVSLWPNSADRQVTDSAANFAAPGVTFPSGQVTKVQPACPPIDESDPTAMPDPGLGPPVDCGNVTVQVTSGPDKDHHTTVMVPPEVSRSALRPGDRVELVRTPPGQGQPVTYSYFGIDRHASLLWLAAAFAIIVIAVARLRGFMALLGLAFSALVITRYMLPALLNGEPGIWIALSGGSAIMFVVLYSTHGISLRTSTALAGTLAGIGIIAGVGRYAVDATRLTGIADESGGILSSFVGNLSFTGLLTCGLIIAGLGVLNDVTITQSSAVWELRGAAPEMPRRRIFTSAMRIGRDHIASTIYTVFFVYAGTAILVLLLLIIYDRPLLDLISSEDISEEIVRTLASGIGLVLAVPITTGIAAAVASPASRRASNRASTRARIPPSRPAAPPDDRHPFEQFWKPAH